MGRNAARRLQKEINEIVQDNVPLCFLPLWKKITIKMQKTSRNTSRSRTCSSAGIRNEFLPLSPLRTHRTRLWSSTSLSLPNMKFKIYTLQPHPRTLTMDSRKMTGKRDPLFPKMYVRRATVTGGDCRNKSICCCVMFQRFDA
jgi:hypothetical protein